MARYTGQKDNSINRNDIYNRDVLYCEEHDEYLYVYFDDGAFRIQFSFDDESTVLTSKIIRANNLIKPKEQDKWSKEDEGKWADEEYAILAEQEKDNFGDS